MHTPPATLFLPDLPDGFRYREDFITADDERRLAAEIESLTFANFEMHGVIAKRRVAFFGETYDRDTAPPIPAFLFPLRAAIGEWAQLDAAAFAMALVNEYRPGAPIGWHRDAPQYGIVAGISLLATCRMKFRPYVSPGADRDSSERRRATHEIILARRSAYLMTGAARRDYEHHIPAVQALRYSITFRTLRSRSPSGPGTSSPAP